MVQEKTNKCSISLVRIDDARISCATSTTIFTGNAIASTGDSPTLTFLNNFYDANRSLISSAATGLSSLDNKTIDHAITGFSESVKVVMNGLDALGQVHPFIGGARDYQKT